MIGWVVFWTVFGVYEVTGLRRFKARFPRIARIVPHDSFSEMVWALERWGGRVAVLAVGAFMLDLTLHFVAHTPLLPWVG